MFLFKVIPNSRYLDGIKITNADYADVLTDATAATFTFLDPPYLSATESRLYGRRGALHLGFDHERFAQTMRICAGKWLLTYDDCATIRKNFDFAMLQEWQLQYGMNNYKQASAAKGNELLLSNFALEKTTAHQELTLF